MYFSRSLDLRRKFSSTRATCCSCDETCGGSSPRRCKRIALGFGERGALVERRILQQRDALSAARTPPCVIVVSATSRLLSLALALGAAGPPVRRLQVVSGTILIAPHGHSDTQMPQPLQ